MGIKSLLINVFVPDWQPPVKQAESVIDDAMMFQQCGPYVDRCDWMAIGIAHSVDVDSSAASLRSVIQGHHFS